MLLTGANSAFNTRPQELMLTALIMAYYEWSGEHRLSVMIEIHGRDPLDSCPDISRTIGWFTTLRLVLLELSAAINTADESCNADSICTVKEQLRVAPDHIRKYGVPFYSTRDVEELPDVVFNYLGHFSFRNQVECVVGISMTTVGVNK